MCNDEISEIMAFVFDTASLHQLSDKNRDQLKDLPNKEFLLDKLQKKRLHFGLIDILFAYCYDWRITQGSHCVESPWNISRLSATLSWFDVRSFKSKGSKILSQTKINKYNFVEISDF